MGSVMNSRLQKGITLVLHRMWPGYIKNPIFIVGCPRSGTSVFGDIMGKAPEFLYLREPRYIWCNVNPKLDVWGYRGPIGENTLYWDASQVNRHDTRRLSRWFDLERFVCAKRRLVEKMPLHVFRLRWLAAMFPDAKFIHIIRHGRDVALSLERAVSHWYPQGHWESSRHFGLFCDYAGSRPELRPSLDLIAEGVGNYPRGLFIWRCAVQEGRSAGIELGESRYCELQYENLVNSPEKELRSIFGFLNEALPEQAVTYAKKVLKPDSLNKVDPNPALTKRLAGDLLDALYPV